MENIQKQNKLWKNWNKLWKNSKKYGDYEKY